MAQSQSPTWGRTAASRFAKSEDEIRSEILKALEGKLSKEFQDYSQWERASPTVQSTPQPSTKTRLKPKSTAISVSSRPLTGTSGVTTCSSLCLHPWNKKPPPVDDTEEILKDGRVLLLRAQIQSKKNSVLAYKKLKVYLEDVNKNMQHDIMSTEDKIHKNVTSLLEKYEKCTSASHLMADRHSDGKKKAEQEFLLSKDVATCENAELESELEGLEQQLSVLLADLQVLRTYKDKEYPVKAMAITKLRNTSQSLSHEHKMELAELEKIINGERDLMVGNREKQTRAILSSAANDAFDVSIPKKLQQVAQNNAILKQEVERNKQEIYRLHKGIEKLQSDVHRLKHTKETRFREHVFPELHPDTAKCNPDDEVVLDIPKQQLLPI